MVTRTQSAWSRYLVSAGVAKLVDARDLKSLGGQPPCRFESCPRHLLCPQLAHPAERAGRPLASQPPTSLATYTRSGPRRRPKRYEGKTCATLGAEVLVQGHDSSWRNLCCVASPPPCCRSLL